MSWTLLSDFHFHFQSEDSCNEESFMMAEKWPELGREPWVGKIPGERNSYPFQYSCLENSTDRGAWWATVHRVTKSQIRLSD